jgi:hypothetical protein
LQVVAASGSSPEAAKLICAVLSGFLRLPFVSPRERQLNYLVEKFAVFLNFVPLPRLVGATSARHMDPERLFSLLKNFIDTMPALHGAPTLERAQWLARASALIEASSNSAEGKRFREAMDVLAKHDYMQEENPAAVVVKNILLRTFAMVELNAPAGSQGAYIPAGNAFDALAAISKVFSEASRSLLVVDPYADEKLFTDFIQLHPRQYLSKF